MESVHFSEEHELLRNTVRRFVEKEVVPNGEDWEAAGNIPREPLKRMGELGLLGISGIQIAGTTDSQPG